jgi:hypothetical protein
MIELHSELASDNYSYSVPHIFVYDIFWAVVLYIWVTIEFYVDDGDDDNGYFSVANHENHQIVL